jgi:oxygen-independent coproporphyrinogen-3 oxidase
LYIHIPFCASRCHYCDFNTYRFDADQAKEYLQGLAQEVDFRAAQEPVRGRKVCSVFLGGGTPSILEASQVVGIVNHCRGAFPFEGGVEISLEANPGTVDLPKLIGMREGGINRLSLGVQAAQDGILQRIGRVHSVHEAEQAFWMAREAGFSNINLDLMFGLPGQSLDAWAEALEWAILLNPEHISAYGLIVEEGTRLYREHRAGDLNLPDEETEAAMYQMTLDWLARAGFEQYEISNFARPGFRCRHNLVYWEHQEYLGLGAGAHSFLDGRRFYNELLPARYLAAIRERGTAVVGGETLSPQLLRSERLMLGLRLRDGLDLQACLELLGIEDLTTSDRVARLLDEGLLLVSDGRLRITDRGLLLANEVIVQLL